MDYSVLNVREEKGHQKEKDKCKREKKAIILVSHLLSTSVKIST